MKNYKEIIIVGGVAVLVFSGLIWLASSQAGKADNQEAAVSFLMENAIAIVGDSSFDFGEISMAKGSVSKIFTIRNNGDKPAVIDKIYTSCMCTNATLILNGKRTGPFGMAGHGFIPRIKKELSAGEEAQVEVVFDPAAHGPAGVGPIQRAVSVETSGGGLELEISALVKP